MYYCDEKLYYKFVKLKEFIYEKLLNKINE